MTEIRRNPQTITRLAVDALATTRTEAGRQLVAQIEAVLDRLTRDYPSQEIAAWSRKIEAARTVLSGGSDPLIAVEAAARGVPELALAEVVLAKGLRFERVVAGISAIRAKAQADLAAAPTQAAANEILATAITRAEAVLTAESA